MTALFERALRGPLLAALVALFMPGGLAAQSDPKLLAPPVRPVAPVQTAPGRDGSPSLLPTAKSSRDATPITTADARSSLKVTKGQGVLPNDQGQVWREYDISPYTLRVRDVTKPEQAVIDWVLRETGTEVWFAEPLGVLSANSTTLRVYHTPEMHDRIRSILERFVAGDTSAHSLGMRLMTVGSPNWRARALSLLKPVDVKSPGVEAWLLTRENATAFYEQLKARADFREHNSPRLEIANGQSQTLARTQPRQYTRGIQLKKEFPFYDVIPGKIDEGYSLQISPLMSLDGQTMEAAITCSVDQIEKLVPLAIDVPTGKESQRVQIQVPQMASWRLSERFRWPVNQVLLLSCGVVATPAPGATGMLSVLSPLGIATNRADALLMIEHRPPPVSGAPPPPPPPLPPTPVTAVVPPIVKPATPSATIGAPTGSANSISRGRY